MKTFLSLMLLLMSAGNAIGQANAIDSIIASQQNEAALLIAQQQHAAAMQLAQSEERRARTYATAMVISAAIIGCGIYFGLRDRKRQTQA